jgi:lipopolysaccharide export system protein LptC
VNAKQVLLFGGLLAGGLVTGWLMQEQGVLTQMPTASPRGPDLFVDDMDLKVIGADGSIHYRLHASRMEHFPYDKHSDLTAPFIQVFGQGHTLWDAHSERGQVADKGDTVWLLGRAVINRPPHATRKAAKVVTRDLMVKPRSDTAETTAKAVITSGKYRIEGVGMRADLRENRVKLLSRVRGEADAGR